RSHPKCRTEKGRRFEVADMPVDAERVQAVFLAATEAAGPTEQAAILERECSSDPELRRRVETLLQAHLQPVSILARPAAAGIFEATDSNTFAEGSQSTPADALSSAPTEDVDPTGGKSRQKRERPLDLSFLESSEKPGSLGRIAHYEVLEVLGRGGFGIVLRAMDESLQRIVAVKVLSPQMAVTSPARKRFLREARAYA